ncbi:hypothetical protein H6F56_00850 [Microcoleus sp. FACHB-672]|nr:hypothetical protein [Microcoleus sp. FACHB-672]
MWDWKWEEIGQFDGDDLSGLCQLVGIPHSGTKAKKIERLKATCEVRKFLYDCGSYEPAVIASLHKKKNLVAMAKKVGVFCHLNKFGIAASLINWQNNCNQRSRIFVKQCKDSVKRKYKQLSMPLF